MVPLAALRESKLNPRKHFNQHKLDELAASIRERGIITPLIVRPNKGTAQHYEIAAGHRRFRAGVSLGDPSIKAPCRILDLTDEQFLEIVTIENLQREDIHPMEEADGFREMLKQSKYAGGPSTLADRIGKPLAYVRGRLELCDLVAVVRESFLQDNITIGHARLISRLPAEQQEEALVMCFSQWQDRALMPVKEFHRNLLHKRGADLSKAPFLLDDVTLKRDAGACTTCPKCTGVQRSLLQDDTDEQMCLDRGCYSQKLNAHIQRKTAAGLVVISTKYSGEIPAGVVSAREYIEAGMDEDRVEDIKQQIDDVRAELDAATMSDRDREDAQKDLAALRKELAEVEAENGECPHMEAAIVVDTNYGHSIGAEKRICRNPECPKHGEAVRHHREIYSGYSRNNDAEERAKEERRKREKKIDWQARKRAWKAILSALGTKPKLGSFELRLAAASVGHVTDADFCKEFGIDVPKGTMSCTAARNWTKTASDEQLVRFIVGAALVAGAKEFCNKEYGDDWPRFKGALQHYKVDLQAIEKEVRAEMKAKATKKTSKVAPAKKATRGKKAAAGDEEDD